MSGGGEKKQSSTSSSDYTTAPWSGAKGYLTDLYATGSDALKSNQDVKIPSDYVAKANDTETSALSDVTNVSSKLGSSASSLSSAADKLASGYYMNPKNDPNFKDAADAAIAPTKQYTTETLLPKVIDSSITGGGTGGGPSAYGGANAGAASDIENERVLRDFNQTAQNTTSKMAEDSYIGAMKLIPESGKLAAAADTEYLAPSTAKYSAGEASRELDQYSLDNALKQYDYALKQPWQGVQNFDTLLTNGNYSNTSGTSSGTTTTKTNSNLWTDILQGGLGVSSIAKSGSDSGAWSWLKGLFSGDSSSSGGGE